MHLPFPELPNGNIVVGLTYQFSILIFLEASFNALKPVALSLN